MILPLLLIFFAAVAAGVVAYGTQPGWAEYQHGLDFIVWSRRLQWPLVTLSILLCLGLVALVISGRRRAWWLIGLGPVLALFVHHFRSDRSPAFAVVENPSFVDPSQASGMGDDDWVLSLKFGDTVYAYPYAALFYTPVVLQADHDRRLVLLWSPYANRVLAFQATDELKARDLEVVSMPGNCAAALQQPAGAVRQRPERPDPRRPEARRPRRAAAGHEDDVEGLGDANPVGRVMTATHPGGPTGPILPAYAAFGLPAPTGPGSTVAGRERATVVGHLDPVAFDPASLTRRPVNTKADGQPVLLFRPAPGDPARAFARTFGDDIRSKFDAKRDPAHPEVLFADVDTQTEWNADGRAVAGNKLFAGKRLTPVPADDGVDWAVLKYWYPQLELRREEPPPETVETPPEDAPPAQRPPPRRGRKHVPAGSGPAGEAARP